MAWSTEGTCTSPAVRRIRRKAWDLVSSAGVTVQHPSPSLNPDLRQILLRAARSVRAKQHRTLSIAAQGYRPLRPAWRRYRWCRSGLEALQLLRLINREVGEVAQIFVFSRRTMLNPWLHAIGIKKDWRLVKSAASRAVGCTALRQWPFWNPTLPIPGRVLQVIGLKWKRVVDARRNVRSFIGGGFASATERSQRPKSNPQGAEQKFRAPRLL